MFIILVAPRLFYDPLVIITKSSLPHPLTRSVTPFPRSGSCVTVASALGHMDRHQSNENQRKLGVHTTGPLHLNCLKAAYSHSASIFLSFIVCWPDINLNFKCFHFSVQDRVQNFSLFLQL